MPGYELVGKEERDAVLEVFDKGGVLYRYGLNDKRQGIFRERRAIVGDLSLDGLVATERRGEQREPFVREG